MDLMAPMCADSTCDCHAEKAPSPQLTVLLEKIEKSFDELDIHAYDMYRNTIKQFIRDSLLEAYNEGLRQNRDE